MSEEIDELKRMQEQQKLEGYRIKQQAIMKKEKKRLEDIKKYNPSSQHHCKTEADFEKALEKLKTFDERVRTSPEAQEAMALLKHKAPAEKPRSGGCMVL